MTSRLRNQDEIWSELEPDEMGPKIQGLINNYKTQQAWRRTVYRRNMQLYECRILAGYAGGYAYDGNGEAEWAFDADRLHLVRSAVNMAVSTLYAPQKPKPQFQTLGATWSMRRKAYRLDRLCEGILNQQQGRFLNMWQFMEDAGYEAALQGTAAIKICADLQRKRITHKLIPQCDVYFDPMEGRTPQNLFHREPIDVLQARHEFPEHSDAIEAAPSYDWFGTRQYPVRAVRVIELQFAYRLPLDEATPGVWAAVIGGEVVAHGEWTAPEFPFVMLQWELHRDGPWAAGIGDTGHRIADECGDLDLRLLNRAVLAAQKHIFYEEGTVNPDELVMNDATVACKVSRDAKAMPTVVQTPPFTDADRAFRELKIRDFWDSAGLSQVSAAARREPGIESGVAQRTLNDTKAGRQLSPAQRYEQAFVALAHQYVWRTRELVEQDPEFRIAWPGRKLMQELHPKDLELDDAEFSISVAPSSRLPHDPAGRQELIQDMYNSRLISQERMMQLMGWPDVEKDLLMGSAEGEYVDSLIERYLDAKEENWSANDYDAPEAWLSDKMTAMRKFASAWFQARIDRAQLPPQERPEADFCIGLLARYMQELDALMAAAQQPPLTPDQLQAPRQIGGAAASPQAAE